MELSEIPISEMTLEALSEWLDQTFGAYVLYGVNHDPSVSEVGGVIHVENGAYHERIGLVEMIKDNMQTQRDEVNDFNAMQTLMTHFDADEDGEDMDAPEEDY